MTAAAQPVAAQPCLFVCLQAQIADRADEAAQREAALRHALAQEAAATADTRAALSASERAAERHAREMERMHAEVRHRTARRRLGGADATPTADRWGCSRSKSRRCTPGRPCGRSCTAAEVHVA